MKNTYSSRNHVSKSFIKSCDKCKANITFAKTINGKWLCVNVISLDKGQSWFWVRKGFNNNFIPTHKCRLIEDSRLQNQAKTLENKLVSLYLKVVKGNDIKLKEKLERILLLSSKRNTRRKEN